MGVMGTILGRVAGNPGTVAQIGQAVQGVAEVFTPNATRVMERSADAQEAALSQLAAEYAQPGYGWFDRFVNGLNRLPRPMLAFGTLALFAYAMVDPVAFGTRMVGLNQVPEPLWWLLGAIVGFYFGAREAYYFRTRPVVPQAVPAAPAGPAADGNAALDEWRAGRG